MKEEEKKKHLPKRGQKFDAFLSEKKRISETNLYRKNSILASLPKNWANPQWDP